MDFWGLELLTIMDVVLGSIIFGVFSFSFVMHFLLGCPKVSVSTHGKRLRLGRLLFGIARSSLILLNKVKLSQAAADENAGIHFRYLKWRYIVTPK